MPKTVTEETDTVMQMASARSVLNESIEETRSLVNNFAPPQTLDPLVTAIPRDWHFSSSSHRFFDILWKLDEFPRQVREMPSCAYPETACTLYAQLDAYLKLVDSHSALVNSDPFLHSRHILTVFLAVMLIDAATVAAYPILLEHPSNLDTTFLDSILVSDGPMLTELCRVQRYFEQRNTNAIHISGPLRVGSLTQVSLEVRFAKNLESMRAARDEILAESERLESLHLKRYIS